jgi:hypothetical protein
LLWWRDQWLLRPLDWTTEEIAALVERPVDGSWTTSDKSVRLLLMVETESTLAFDSRPVSESSKLWVRSETSLSKSLIFEVTVSEGVQPAVLDPTREVRAVKSPTSPLEGPPTTLERAVRLEVSESRELSTLSICEKRVSSSVHSVDF